MESLSKMDLFTTQISKCQDESTVLATIGQILHLFGQENLSASILSWIDGPIPETKVVKPSLIDVESTIFNHATSSQAQAKLQIYVSQHLVKLPTTGNLLDIPLGKERFALNPSIIRHGDGYLCIVRVVNYKINREGYTIYHPDNIIITENFLVKLDMDLHPVSIREIQGPSPIFHSKFRGMEDCRIFKFDERIGFTCTTLDNNPRCIPQISLAWLPEDWEQQNPIIVTDLTLQQGPTEGRMEKNWLPFQHDNEIHAYYSYSPLTKLQLSSTGTTTYVEKLDLPLNFVGFRGSAGPIPFRNAHLIVVHEVTWIGNKPIYTHRFLEVGDDGPISLSQAWYLTKIGIEFVSGIEVSDGKLVLTAGVEDSSAWIFTIDISEVEKILIPIESYLR